MVQQPIDELASVGCGLKHAEQEIEKWTNGILTIKTGWGTDNQGNIKAPSNIDYQPIINPKVSQWLNHKTQLDPNDPVNAETLDTIEVNFND